VIPIITGLKQAPTEWVRRLREIDPIRDQLSYLEFVWYAPAERWCLYEMVPAYESEFGPTVPLPILDELKGPDPDLIPETAPLITHRQWLLYQNTGRWARPSWVLQGTKGGHQIAFDHADKELLQRTGRKSEPPAVGELPYAPFDERAVQAILRMNKMHRVKNDLDEFRRVNTGAGAKRQYREAMRAARAQQIAYLESQFEEASQDFAKAYSAGELENAPVSQTDWQKKDEEESRNYIETGSFGLSPE